MSEPQALVVDDEPDLRELLSLTLTRMGVKVDAAEDLAEARHKLSSNHYDFCLTDMRLPDGNGLSLIKQVNRDHPELPIAMITAFGKVEDAVTALKYGAFDFVSKPVNLDDLRNLVRTAIKMRHDDAEKHAGKKNVPKPGPASLGDKAKNTQQNTILDRMIGHSEPIQKVRQTIIKLARSQA
ncbi:MAG: response regulator, partial [Pseudomonadota bacterium]